MRKQPKVNWKTLAKDAISRVVDLQTQLADTETKRRYWETVADRLHETVRRHADTIDLLRSDQAIDEAMLSKQRERLIKLTGIKNRCGAVMQAVRQIFFTKESTYELSGKEWKRVWSQIGHLRLLEINMKGLDREISELEVDDAIPQTDRK